MHYVCIHTPMNIRRMSAATEALLREMIGLSAPMVTVADVHQILSALPETEERLTWDSATFRVRNKIFAMIHPSEQKVTIKAGNSEQAALLAINPETYAPAPYTGRFGWVTIQISSVRLDDLHDLIVEAWRQTAPKRLVATYDSERSREG